MAVSTSKANEPVTAKGPLEQLKAYVKVLGPGLITGASDDDPAGIGTYSQAGARFGYAPLWTALFTFPLMLIVQEMCARIALQTGKGLAANIREQYPRPLLYICVLLLLIANTINIGADLGAMAASAQMLLGVPFLVWLAVITLLIIAMQVFVKYKQVARWLRFFAFSLLAYVAVVFVVGQDWGQALRSTLIPALQWDKDYLSVFVAILGTTISPYLFFWQANEEVEEEIQEGKKTPAARKGVTHTELNWMRADVASGMFFSNAVMWFIIATTASTLFVNGVHQIDSAPQAADALKPIGGDLARILFAAGILGTGFLGVPVLAGSGAYAVAETLRVREGLDLKLWQAPVFYGVIAVATLCGAAINLLGINPIQALYYSAVINGFVAPPLLVFIVLLGSNRRVMADKVNSRLSNMLGWLAVGLMTLAAVGLVLTSF